MEARRSYPSEAMSTTVKRYNSDYDVLTHQYSQQRLRATALNAALAHDIQVDSVIPRLSVGSIREVLTPRV